MDHTSFILRMSAGGRDKSMCSRTSVGSSDNKAESIVNPRTEVHEYFCWECLRPTPWSPTDDAQRVTTRSVTLRL